MKRYIFFVLFIITLIGLSLRFYQLSSVPASLARDEVSASYNAYSLIYTGKDEHGIFMPIAFKAFGDWKLPVEIYLVIPGILLFGLNEFSTRLPEALLGSLSIPVFYFVITKIVGDKRYLLTLFTTFFLAISPWHVYMSRVAIGYNVLGLFFFLAGVYFFYNFLQGKKWHLFFATVSFIFTLFSYTAFHIFTPLFLLVLYILYRKKITLNRFVGIQFILFLSFYTLASYSVLEANVQKIAGTSLWHDPEFYKNEIFEKRQAHENTFFTKIIHNKPVTYITKLTTNYATTFSPEFLVTKGAVNPINNLKGMGNMYIFEYILFVIGIAFLLYKKEPFLKIILVWVLISAIPAIITKEAPQSTRNLMMVPMLSFLSGYGLYSLYSIFISKKSYERILIGLGLAAFSLFGMWNITQFLDNYFVHLDRDRGEYWNAGYKEIIKLAQEKNPQKIVMGDQSRSPYVYFLFYNRYNPDLYLYQVRRDKPTWDNFQHIMSFDKYYFVENIDFVNDVKEKNTLYIERLEKIPQGYPISGIITDKTGIYKHAFIFTDNMFCQKEFANNVKPPVCF